jgi:hypothetical protein
VGSDKEGVSAIPQLGHFSNLSESQISIGEKLGLMVQVFNISYSGKQKDQGFKASPEQVSET